MVHPPESRVPNGAFVEVRNRDGELLGRGLLNRQSEVVIRMIAGPTEEGTFAEVLRRRLQDARALREEALKLPDVTNAYRLVHGEGDRLSGLIVDRYGPVAVVLLHSLGYVQHGQLLEEELLRIPGIDRVIFRADPHVSKQEGFHLPPPESQEPVPIREGKVRYEVDLVSGHKSGMFLDQRDNRKQFSELCLGQRVLDLCTNVGGFAISAAALGKAKDVTGVDLDETALAQARHNAQLNQARVSWVHADLFPFLRERIEAKDRWQRIVLDPPRLAKGAKDQSKALRQYADMNRLAIAALAPRGILLTCSCSSVISESAFLNVIHSAGAAVGRELRVLRITGAAPDHPWAMGYPEGRYLKAVLVQAAE
jgi:23S rRNA (cytosine1962-C5)-methyltransferase